MTSLTPHPPPYLLFRPSILLSFIYLCSALPLSTHSRSLSHLTMVATTRPKNKLSHPAAPVMTQVAKKKAGIKVKQRPKKATKDDTIQELRARITTLENPDEGPFSKEPLVCIQISNSILVYVLTPPSLLREAVRR